MNPAQSRDLDALRTRLHDQLERHGQAHLLRFWDQLDSARRQRLAGQIEAIDLDQLDRVITELVLAPEAALDLPAAIEPIEVVGLPRTDAEHAAMERWRHRGEAMLAAGEVGVILVAGGQGTRLGYDGPKGTFPIAPVSSASLFQIHAEKIVGLGRRHGRPLPLYVMTSPENHQATVDFFAEHDQFGLDHVRCFTQGTMPAVDRHTGAILMEAVDVLATSPDGHGGTLTALAAPGTDGAPSCLDEMRERGVRTLFYFQVDNPLVKIADPAFLGIHREREAEMAFKVVEKAFPDERVGVVVRANGRPQVIEYSDLPAHLAERRLPDGRLELSAGSIAIHILERAFIERLVAGGGQLPFHRAVKKVPHIDASGQPVEPTEPNGVKFERFIFDALPLAGRWAIVETDRREEFEPLKNRTGPDSPATVRQRMSDLFGEWLEAAGVPVARRPDGTVPFGIEISPLYALDAAELRTRIPPGMVVEGPTLLR